MMLRIYWRDVSLYDLSNLLLVSRHSTTSNTPSRRGIRVIVIIVVIIIINLLLHKFGKTRKERQAEGFK
jgi:hypothetical protein